MKTADHDKVRNKNQRLRNWINLCFILAGLLVVFVFMSYMQRQYSIIKANQAAASALDTVIGTLDANTEKVTALQERYHADNQAVLDDIFILLEGRQGEELLTATTAERSASLSRLSAVTGPSSFLFVIDGNGRVVAAPEESAIGDNLAENGTLTADQLAILVRNEQGEHVRLLGTRCIKTVPGGTDTVTYDEVLAQPAGSGVTAYFYSMPVGNHYLVYAVDASELDKQLDALRDVGPILSGVVMDNGGFVFAVDSETGCFLFFDDGHNRLDGQPIAESGLNGSVLKDQYSGIQTIAGTDYQCLSRRYASPFYGEYTVITAVSAVESVFSGDKTAIGLSVLTFVVCAGILLLYAYFLRMDPDQLAHYDEDVRTLREARAARRRDHSKTIRNIRLFAIHGEQYYLKGGIAGRLAPVIAISALLVFIISWNSQTLVEISKGISQSATAIRQLEVSFSNRDNSSGIIMERYQNQYLSKLGLISFILEEDASLSDQLEGSADSGNVHAYINADLAPVIDDSGRPVRSIANMPLLQALAKAAPSPPMTTCGISSSAAIRRISLPGSWTCSPARQTK